MGEYRIPYGHGAQELTLDDARLAGLIEPRHIASGELGETELVARALKQPIASPQLCELARGKRRVLVITSDHTRPMPSRITLPLLLSEIREGSPEARIVVLVATGMHRPTTPDELRARFGDEIMDNELVEVHKADADGDMAYFGALPSGGALRLNRRLLWAELVVAEGFIEPHFFAGFSGGRKSILPGVAAKETVLYNHNARFISDPSARQGELDENPIHRDMLYAAKVAGLKFILNVLIDADKRVTAAFAGDPEGAHAEGCRLLAQYARVAPVEADIAITSNGGYPLDQNVYQAVKGMTAAEACVKRGGAIIMCAALGDGHGGEAFYRWFADRDGAEAVERDIRDIPPEHTLMDQWEAQILARVLNRATVFFVTGEENRALIEQMHMRWCADVNAALNQATVLLGEASTVAVIPDGVGVIARV